MAASKKRVRTVPVIFVHMCCTSGSHPAIAGQAASGGVYFRRVLWTSERPWLYMPPPMERVRRARRRR